MKIRDKMTPSLRLKQKQLATVPKKAYEYFKSITPIKSGNARRSTHLSGHTIKANYPYAERLDNGYSKQAPDGMSKPTEEYVEKLLNNIFRKK